jgi:uncharacterized damage-inducible protein DinB
MDTLERLLRHDAWTTRQLLLRAQELSDAQLDRPFDIGHRSLRCTLGHIISQMEFWCDAMQRQPYRWKIEPDNSIETMLARLDTVTPELLTLATQIAAHQLEDAAFIAPLEPTARMIPLGTALAHLPTHGTHHRAQCLYMLKLLGLEDLPEGDAFSWERQHRNFSAWPEA